MSDTLFLRMSNYEKLLHNRAAFRTVVFTSRSDHNQHTREVVFCDEVARNQAVIDEKNISVTV